MCVDFTDVTQSLSKRLLPPPFYRWACWWSIWKRNFIYDGCPLGLQPNFDAQAWQKQVHIYKWPRNILLQSNTFWFKKRRYHILASCQSSFLHQIGKNVIAYVDDILVKSKNIDDHPNNLEGTFDTLKQYGMHLNVSKFPFDIKKGKFFGFYIGKSDISD